MNFDQYLESLGGEQFTQYSAKPYTYGGYGNNRNPAYIEQAHPNTKFGSNVGLGNNAPRYTQNYASYGGYRDSEGGFLGYGSDPNSLYNNSPDLQRQYTEYVSNEPRRQAQQLENQQLQAEYARLQQEALTQERQQDLPTLPTLANFNPAPQQFSGGLMGQQPMQQQQPMQNNFQTGLGQMGGMNQLFGRAFAGKPI